MDNIKVQKEAGLHLTTDAERARELKWADLMNKINRVTSGKAIVNIAVIIDYVSIFITFFFIHLFISGLPPNYNLNVSNTSADSDISRVIGVNIFL